MCYLVHYKECSVDLTILQYIHLHTEHDTYNCHLFALANIISSDYYVLDVPLELS